MMTRAFAFSTHDHDNETSLRFEEGRKNTQNQKHKKKAFPNK
jgi:hypothetical protein